MFGVCCLVVGVCRLLVVVRCLVFGVWWLLRCIWCFGALAVGGLVFGLRCSVFGLVFGVLCIAIRSLVVGL